MTREEALRLADEQLRDELNPPDEDLYGKAIALAEMVIENGLQLPPWLTATVDARERLADKIMEEGK